MVQFMPFDGSNTIVKLTNFIFRVLQFLIAIPILAIYANQITQDGYSSEGCRFNTIIGDGNLSLAVAAATISLITALVYMVMIVFVEFKWVVRACPWDLLVMILLAATFGQMKKRTYPGSKEFYDIITDQCKVSGSRVKLIQNTTWVDLTAFLLWIITFLLGVVALVFGRFRGSKPVY